MKPTGVPACREEEVLHNSIEEIGPAMPGSVGKCLICRNAGPFIELGGVKKNSERSIAPVQHDVTMCGRARCLLTGSMGALGIGRDAYPVKYVPQRLSSPLSFVVFGMILSCDPLRYTCAGDPTNCACRESNPGHKHGGLV